MNRYLFFINQQYSYSILRPLQEAILRRGDEVAWFVHGTDDQNLRPEEKQLHTVAQVQSYQPAAVFVPGNWVPDFFPGVKVEVFHGLANDETGKKGHYRIRNLFDLYCTHAPLVTARFQALAAVNGTFKVKETGWPKLDPLFDCTQTPVAEKPSVGQFVEQQYLQLKAQLGSDKPVVFYASTFSPSLTSAPLLVNKIRQLADSGKWHWLVTLHPKTPQSLVDTYKAMAGPNFTFMSSELDVLPMLKVADVMLCDTSSISLEFMLLDKPVVTFRTKQPGPHVIDVQEEDAIESALEQALTRPDDLMLASNEYCFKLHATRDGKSSERVLQAVDEFIKNDLGHLKPKPLNLWRKWQMRKRMAYYHLR